NIGQIGPSALVADFAGLSVVPSVLNRREVVRIGDRLCVLVSDNNAVAVEYPMSEGIADNVPRVPPATAGPQDGPAGVQKRNESVLQPVRIADTVDAIALSVI